MKNRKYKMNKLLTYFVFVILLFPAASAFSQEGTIFGVVRDSAGRFLPGTSITMSGKALGATDDNGKFSFHIPAGQQQKIVFSFTGLEPDTVIVQLRPGEKRELNRILKGRISNLP